MTRPIPSSSSNRSTRTFTGVAVAKFSNMGCEEPIKFKHFVIDKIMMMMMIITIIITNVILTMFMSIMMMTFMMRVVVPYFLVLHVHMFHRAWGKVPPRQFVK